MTKPSRLEILVVVLILSVAIFFRFYHLDQTPPGLYPDEAMNGSNALIANATGDYKIFYTENNGREGLFINLQAFSVKLFGIHPWALRGVSAAIGVLTVLGLYLLVRELFERRIAALCAFLLAISFWHVNFSRIGFRAIMVPLILVYLYYFLWRGLKTGHWFHYFIAGLLTGLGFYTYTAYRVAPLITIIVFINYWWYVKRTFSHENYTHARMQLIRGFCLLMITAFFVALPMGIFVLWHPDQITPQSYLSVFGQADPIKALWDSVIRTLGMFSFVGDGNQRHNISGMPMLGWPLGVLFIIGFFKELGHWLSRKHGSFSPVHTLLFSWFFVMLLPGFLSIQAPHALRTIGVIPVAIIFVGRGLWWVFRAIGNWYDAYHPDHPYQQEHHVSPAAIWALIILLFSFAVYEYTRYFNTWAKDPLTAQAFNADYVAVADEINQLPAGAAKYVVIEAEGVIALGLPVPAETVMFLTDSATPETQEARNIHYLTADQARGFHFPRNSNIFYLR